MTDVPSIYEGWARANRRIINRIRTLTPEELALGTQPDRWPVWAAIAHLAGTRVYWLCRIFKEPGAEATPFDPNDDEGWEDHLDHPRGADELVTAMQSTWGIIERCLNSWTLPMLDEVFERRYGNQVQRHTRKSVLFRMSTHDAYHAGEVSRLLGLHGMRPMDPWDPQLD